MDASQTIVVEADRPRQIEVVLKIVERCNLACPYCYFFFRGDESYKRHPPVIPERTVRGLIEFLRDAALNRGIKVVRIDMHGGEPLMMKKRVFRNLCETLEEEVGSVCKLIICMQTNGVLIDEEWIEIFEEHKVRVGVSFDGPEHIHNRTRITKKGRGTYAETRRGWELLLEAAAQKRISYPGLLSVVAPDYSGAEIFNHYAFDLRAKSLDFLLPDLTHESPEATPEYIAECGRFMIEVFDAWSSAKSKCKPGFILDAVGPMFNDTLCRESALHKSDPKNLMVVSSSGEISPDDVLRSVDARFRDTGLTVFTRNIDEVLSFDMWEELSRAHSQPPEECGRCIWFSACRGGLLPHRYSSEKGLDNPSVYCDALKAFHARVASGLVSSGYPVEEVERRLETRWPLPTASADDLHQAVGVS